MQSLVSAIALGTERVSEETAQESAGLRGPNPLEELRLTLNRVKPTTLSDLYATVVKVTKSIH